MVHPITTEELDALIAYLGMQPMGEVEILVGMVRTIRSRKPPRPKECECQHAQS